MTHEPTAFPIRCCPLVVAMPLILPSPLSESKQVQYLGYTNCSVARRVYYNSNKNYRLLSMLCAFFTSFTMWEAWHPQGMPLHFSCNHEWRNMKCSGIPCGCQVRLLYIVNSPLRMMIWPSTSMVQQEGMTSTWI